MDVSLQQFARRIIATEATAVSAMADAIDEAFEAAVRRILDCRGAVVASGVGKAGHVATKVSATFSSTGTPSHFLSATDAVHGDLGTIRRDDIVMIFSFSGKSEEILRLLNLVKKLDHPVIAVTGSRDSDLGRFADITLTMGPVTEACPLGLAPSASTTAMLALGDALALSVMNLRHFTAEDFALFHPGGQLGRNLLTVGQAMTFRLGENLPVASDALTVGQVLRDASRIKRRSGAVILTNAQGRISGIFTDGDLRRLITDNDGTALKQPMHQVMKSDPKRIAATALAAEAMAMMRLHRIDELPVVDADDRPVGLIDVQDLVMLKMLEDK